MVSLKIPAWRHVENLYAMFDHLRQQFPKVIFQNCAGGGGRLDLGILHRFDNTELSDWMREPRGVKILNGMTWLLAPGNPVTHFRYRGP